MFCSTFLCVICTSHLTSTTLKYFCIFMQKYFSVVLAKCRPTVFFNLRSYQILTSKDVERSLFYHVEHLYGSHFTLCCTLFTFFADIYIFLSMHLYTVSRLYIVPFLFFVPGISGGILILLHEWRGKAKN